MAKDFKIRVTKVLQAIGYGEGSISYKSRVDAVGAAVLDEVEKLIQSGDVLVPVDRDKSGQALDDDGCGDGRAWRKILEGKVERFRSLHRPKVFGGGLTMGVASVIGMGEATHEKLGEVFKDRMHTFRKKLVDYGAHTDNHAHGKNSGCGAIDKAPQIIGNAVQFEADIRGTIDSLGLGDESLDGIFQNYRAYAQEVAGEDYSGAAVAEKILNNGKVVKELADDHLEMFVVLNTVEGYTVNQAKVRSISHHKVQVFAVDVWRLQQIAQRLYSNQAKQHHAFLSMLVYTLATAATLTKGDLPVYVIEASPALVTA